MVLLDSLMARALVRHLAATFRDSIKSVPQPIDMDLAYQQHREYVNLLRKLVGSAAVLELPADDSHPGQLTVPAA